MEDNGLDLLFVFDNEGFSWIYDVIVVRIFKMIGFTLQTDAEDTKELFLFKLIFPLLVIRVMSLSFA